MHTHYVYNYYNYIWYTIPNGTTNKKRSRSDREQKCIDNIRLYYTRDIPSKYSAYFPFTKKHC